MAFGIELIRVPEALIPASFKRVKIDKSAEKASTKERNDTVNPYMRPDQALQSVLYKTAAEIDKATAIINQTHSVIKSIKRGVPTKVATPRVNDVVAQLQERLAELSKQVEMLVVNQRRSPFDGCFTRTPEKSPVQKSVVEPSIFDGVYSPRDVTPIVKAAEKEGFWPLSIKHEGLGNAVIKSSGLCLGEHAEVQVPLSKSVGADTNIFDGAFARV